MLEDAEVPRPQAATPPMPQTSLYGTAAPAAYAVAPVVAPVNVSTRKNDGDTSVYVSTKDDGRGMAIYAGVVCRVTTADVEAISVPIGAMLPMADAPEGSSPSTSATATVTVAAEPPVVPSANVTLLRVNVDAPSP